MSRPEVLSVAETLLTGAVVSFRDRASAELLAEEYGQVAPWPARVTDMADGPNRAYIVGFPVPEGGFADHQVYGLRLYALGWLSRFSRSARGVAADDPLFAYYLVTRLSLGRSLIYELGLPSGYEDTMTSLVALCSGCAESTWREPGTLAVIQLNRDHGAFAAPKAHELAMDRGEIKSCEYCGSITREEHTRKMQAQVKSTPPTPVKTTEEAFGEDKD